MKHSVSVKARLSLVMLIMTVLLGLGVVSASAQEPSPALQIELELGIPPNDWELHDTIHAQVAQFEAETGIKVSIDDDYSGPVYQDRADTALHYGEYDVFYVTNALLNRWVTDGYLLPLDGLIDDEEDFYPSVLDSVRVAGAIYCIPRDTWSWVLFYNRDSFDKAGLAYPTDDWTWDDLRENSQLLLEADSEPMILDSSLDYWTPFLHQAGGKLTDSETGAWAFNSTEGLEALTFYLDVFQIGRTNIGNDVWGGSAFSGNLAGMTVQGNWMMDIFMQGDSAVNWGAVELPSHHTEATAVSSQCYGVFSETKNLEASLLLANFLTSAESQTELLFTSELPSRMSVSEAYTDYWLNRADEKGFVWHRDDIQTFFDSLNHGFRLESFSTRLYTDSLEYAFRHGLEQAVNGEITHQDMLNLMEAVVLIKEP